MVEVVTPRPGESFLDAVQRQRRENAGPGIFGRVIGECSELQAGIICADAFRLGLVSWSFQKMAALRDAITQAEIRLRFKEERKRREDAVRQAVNRGPRLLVL